MTIERPKDSTATTTGVETLEFREQVPLQDQLFSNLEPAGVSVVDQITPLSILSHDPIELARIFSEPAFEVQIDNPTEGGTPVDTLVPRTDEERGQISSDNLDQFDSRLLSMPIYDLINRTPPELRDPMIDAVLSTMLHAGGFEAVGPISSYTKERAVIADVETTQGKMFLKLVDAQSGINELERGQAMAAHFPVEHALRVVQAGMLGLVVQPYIQGIGRDSGMLTDVFSQLEVTEDPRQRRLLLGAIRELYGTIGRMSEQTLGLAAEQRVPNDIFFHDRLQANQRLEQNCSYQLFNLNGTQVPWEEMLRKKWVVDGVEYQDSLARMIERAQITLNPDRQRLLSLCHGDGTEMNYISNAQRLRGDGSTPHIFKMIDLETAGLNSTLGDSVNHLVYMTVMAAHTVPRYFKEHFKESPRAVANYEAHQADRGRPGMRVKVEGDRIIMSGVDEFGTSPVRKELAGLFVSSYMQKILDRAESTFGSDQREAFEDSIKSCLFMRYLGVHAVHRFNAEDQAKIFGLLFKTIGEPASGASRPVLERFLGAI
jgi:hypothetical protein